MLTKKKPVVKGHLLYDSIYKKYKCIESENEVVVAQDWWSRSLEENEEQLLMSTGFFFVGDEMLWSWLCDGHKTEYTKNHYILCYKWVNCIVCD